MTSLFLRMRLVHWIGITLLVCSALFLTQNVLGTVVQRVIAVVVVVVHDLDEKRWGVRSLRDVVSYMECFKVKDLSRACEVDVRFNSEMQHVLAVIDEFRNAIRVVQQAESLNRLLAQNEQAVHDLTDSALHLGQASDTLDAKLSEFNT